MSKTQDASSMPLEEYIESDEIGETAREKLTTIKEAFENGDAVRIETEGTRDSFLYQLDDGRYFHGFHCEGRWRRFAYDEFTSSLKIIGAINDNVVPVDVEDTKLWHASYGLYEPED